MPPYTGLLVITPLLPTLAKTWKLQETIEEGNSYNGSLSWVESYTKLFCSPSFFYASYIGTSFV